MKFDLPPARLLLTGFFVSFGGSFHYGYQLVVTNPTQEVFQRFLNASYQFHYLQPMSEESFRLFWGLIVALLMLGATIGCLFMPLLAEYLGRKYGQYVSSTLFITSAMVCALAKPANSFEQFAVGRFVSGVAIGLSLGFQSLYLTEISPKRYRGFMNTLTGFMVQVGLLVGSIVAMPVLLGTDDLWPIIYWIKLTPSLLLLVFLSFMHETPSYLLRQGMEEDARAAIRAYHGAAADVDAVVKEIKTGFERSTTAGWARLWADVEARRGVLLGVLVSTAMSFSGIAVINAFATYLLMETGFSERGAAFANFGISLASIVGAGFTVVVIDKFGRRPLLIWANVSLCVLNLAVIAIITAFNATQASWCGFALFAVTASFLVVFSVGPGPIAFFISGELVEQSFRSKATMIATLAQMIGRTIVLLIFFPVEEFAHQYSFLMFAVPLFVSAALLYFYLPETKLKTVREIMESVAELAKMGEMTGKMANKVVALSRKVSRISLVGPSTANTRTTSVAGPPSSSKPKKAPPMVRTVSAWM